MIRSSRYVAASFVFAPLLVACAGQVALAASTAHGARPVERFERLLFRGDTTLPKVLSRPATVELRAPEIRVGVRPPARRPAAANEARSPNDDAAPRAPNLPVVPANPKFFGFSGLTSVDQYNAGTGAYANSQFDLEPPNPAICAGNGFVVEAVENAVAVYGHLGTPLTAPTAFSQFFHEPAARNPSTYRYGPFLTGPKCYFDRDTQRWFLSEQEIDLDPETGYHAYHSAILLAVSQNGDPTAGYSIYAVDTTDTGFGDCPCYGDQPVLGADSNGIFISVNQYVLHPSGAQNPAGSAQIYALSKFALARHGLPTVVHIDAGDVSNPDNLSWLSIQPATSPDTSASRTPSGIEYFLSMVDPFIYSTSEKRIAVWALSNTQSLRDKIPNLVLQHIVIASEIVAQPPPAVQRAGPAPLAASLHAPVEGLATANDAMNQVVFAGGRLWSGVDTSVRSAGAVDAGVAFFAVAPSFDRSGSLTAKIVRQGYVAVAGQNVMYPAIGVNAGGGAVLAATLSGPAYYPTAVYVTPDGNVHNASAGTGPEDGYSGYFPFSGFNVANWGSSSAAVADSDGSLWIATEYIPGGRRTILTNWGTFIGHVPVQR